MSDLYNNSSVAATWPLAADQDQGRLPSDAIEAELLTLFDAFHQPLLRYALSFGLEVQDAEDLLQEVFLALFQHLTRSKPRDNLKSWLFRVMHNLALKRRMAYSRQSCTTFQLEPMDCWADPAPGPEEAFLFTERQVNLNRVLRALPDKDQACLRLRAEGLRYREISKVLGISLGAVCSSMVRALERLRRVQ
jgi:RNA polymerase sigma-70 factor (ECF subfamily)